MISKISLATCLLSFATIAHAQPIPLKTMSFEAPSVGRTLKYNVALPQGYEGSEKRFPVVYLLHGYSGNYTNWGHMGAARAAQPLDLIVVMPDGGNSWYVNWGAPEGDQPSNWEDCVIKDLIPHVDATFRTVARREGRAINGLSMGGFGAMSLGLRHPEMFCSVGSQSGALMLAHQAAERFKKGETPPDRRRELSDKPNPEIGVEGFSSQAERTPKGRPFSTAEQAEGYDPFHLVTTVPVEKLPHLYIDCGTEDGLLNGSQNFAKLLMEKHIPFTFAESAGAHNGAYWTREIHDALAVQAVILRRNLKAIENDSPKP